MKGISSFNSFFQKYLQQSCLAALVGLASLVPALGQNTAPTISNLQDQTTTAGQPTAPQFFTVGDAQTSASDLSITHLTSNGTIVPFSNIQFSGSGATRAVLVTPAAGQSGTVVITVFVSDGLLSTSDSFTVTVGSGTGNTVPSMSDIPNQTLTVNGTTGALSFVINDTETAASGLSLSHVSSNPALIPDANVVLGGSGNSRTVTVTPLAGATGSSIITISVSDGQAFASDSFTVTVTGASGNNAPTISDIPNQTVAVGGNTGALTFTVGDIETSAAELAVSATSSNPTLVPSGNILTGGSGSSRTILVLPASGLSGTATITVTVSDGSLSISDSFVISVGQVNTSPTVSDIPNQTTTVSTPTAAIAFTIGDAETVVGSLSVTPTSSNPSLVPSSNILFSGSGSTRSMVLVPLAGQTGTATITITVSDGSLSVTDTFVLTVSAASGNTAPTISDIPNQTTPVGIPTPAISFTVSDAQTAATSLVVTPASSNPTLIPSGNILFSGSGNTRSMVIVPAAGQSGVSTVTLSVSDGALTASDTFTVTVGQVSGNNAPTISDIPNQSTPINVPTASVPFTIADAETSGSGLTVTATSSNPTLAPVLNILFSGAGNNRSLIVVPASGATGSAIITVMVSDGTLSATDTFTLTVASPGNTPPTLSDIANKRTAEGTPTQPVPFSVNDAQTTPANLIVTATSSNPVLVPQANLLFSGNGTNRALIVFPAATGIGTVTITVVVNDGSLIASDSFLLKIGLPPNNLPTLSDIPDQIVTVDSSSGAIAFTVGDVESTAASLVLTATSSNTDVVPASGVVLGGSGANRTINVTPRPGTIGTTVIAVRVADDEDTNADTFVVTVSPPNTPPSISDVHDQFTTSGTATAILSFTIGDAETVAGGLRLTATSSNPILVPNSSIFISGSGSNRIVQVAPAAGQTGTATISIAVTDGSLTATDSFLLTVNPSGNQNTPPRISDIANQATGIGIATPPIAFTVVDGESAPSALQVFATSSDTNLVPTASILVQGAGTNRTLTITPVAGRSGNATVIVSVSDGIFTAVDTFVLTVSSTVNTPPTLSNLADMSLQPGVTSSPVSFTVADAQTAAGALTVTATSSNTALVPNASLLLGGSGGTRTIAITPAAGGSGTATITVVVNDGSLTTSDSFIVTVGAPPTNTPPVISQIANQTTAVGTPTSTIAFVVSDIETAAGNLIVSGTSTNTALVPNSSVLFSGLGTNRVLVIFPAAGLSGITRITVSVSDGTASSETSFVLTVGQVNTAPTISAIAGLSVSAGVASAAIPFTVGDAETAAGNLVVSVSSSNTNLLSPAAVQIGGSNGNRTLTLTPANQAGAATLTVTVSDGALNASASFVVTVTQTVTNQPPTLSAIANQTTPVGTPTATLSFTVGDLETSAASLILSGTSSDGVLVPNSNILFSGVGSNRVMVIFPAAGQSGSTVITVGVSDGVATTHTTFLLTVGTPPPNTPPTLSALADVSTTVGAAIPAMTFTVTDAETDPTNLVVTASSDNATLLPPTGIVAGGVGANRTLSLTAAAGQSGSARVTVNVSDGDLSANRVFTLTVEAVADSPRITQEPLAQTVAPGADATFVVVAGGAPPLAFQWLFNGSTIVGANSSSLTVTNVSSAALGRYSVVVSNPFGFAISGTAELTLRDSVRLATPRLLSGGLVELTITGNIGETYEIQASSDLVTWTALSTVTNTTGSVKFIDPSPAPGHRFYRVRLR